MSLSEILGASAGKIGFSDITWAYGTSNEVSGIIRNIYEKHIPPDRCTIACADTAAYSQLFLELYSILMTFGCGLPITNYAPVKLLREFYNWQTGGFNGVDSLNKMLFSGSFERSLLLEKLAVIVKAYSHICLL